MAQRASNRDLGSSGKRLQRIMLLCDVVVSRARRNNRREERVEGRGRRSRVACLRRATGWKATVATCQLSSVREAAARRDDSLLETWGRRGAGLSVAIDIENVG